MLTNRNQYILGGVVFGCTLVAFCAGAFNIAGKLLFVPWDNALVSIRLTQCFT